MPHGDTSSLFFLVRSLHTDNNLYLYHNLMSIGATLESFPSIPNANSSSSSGPVRKVRNKLNSSRTFTTSTPSFSVSDGSNKTITKYSFKSKPTEICQLKGKYSMQVSLYIFNIIN